jgi:hypothetical protein
MNAERHTKQIEIAGETITAEYFEINQNFTNKKFEDQLTLWDKITWPYYRLKYKVKDFYWDIRYAFQRAHKGYDYLDVISTYSKFMDRYTKILTKYKENKHGYPARMPEEEWNKIIETMLFHLHYMDEDNVYEELCKDVPDNWIPRWETSGEIMEHHKTEFFKLFSEHFYDLWD